MRVAQVGLGYFGRFHLSAWERAEGAELVGLAERDPARVEGVSIPVFSDAVEMAEALRPDIIDIAAPPPAHLPLIEALAPICPNLISQKPFCQSVEEAERAVAGAKAAGARVIVHENFRNQPWHREVARMLDDGVIGAPLQATFRLRPGDGQGPEAYLERQPYFQQMERFLIHETAIHFIDLFRGFFGEPAGVYADLRRLNPAIAGEDAGVIVMDWPDGRRAVIDGNRLVDHPAENTRLTMGEMWVEGAGGVIRLDGLWRLWRRAHGEREEAEHVYSWEDRDFGGDCVFASCESYLDAFRTGAPHPTEAPAYLRNMRIENAAYISAAEARRIAL